MGKELLLVIEKVSNEKEIDKDVLFRVMEESLSIAIKKKLGDIEDIFEIKVTIDKNNGTYKVFKVPTNCIIREQKPIPEEIEVSILGRIPVTAAKKFLFQQIRKLEKETIANKFLKKINRIVHGEVKKSNRESLILDLGENAEGILYRTNLLNHENYRLNDRVRSVITKIEKDIKGIYQIFLSRTHENMLRSLLSIEVPEVLENLIEIVNVVRDPGCRAKVAVKSNDNRVDPVGSCVGMRGSRIQAISNELQGEKIDVILWDDDPAQLVINSLAPADIISLVQDEDINTMDVVVKESDLSQAIGKNGQNVRLSSLISGWKINILSESTAEEKKKDETLHIKKNLIETLDIDHDIAEVLIEKDFTSLEEIAYKDEEELLNIDGFDKDLVEELQERAKTGILSEALSYGPDISEDLLNMDDMQKSWVYSLAKKGISNREALAELSLDDLMDILPVSKDIATKFIMTAREPWFK